MALDAILDSIPDFSDWKKAEHWLAQGLSQNFTQYGGASKAGASVEWLEWRDIAGECSASEGSSEARGDSRALGNGGNSPNGLFGFYSFIQWRKFVLACFLADLISYPAAPEVNDQVDFPRLAFIMNACPERFRIGFLKLKDGHYWPFGYTATYPISESQFRLLEKTPDQLKDRFIPPEAGGRSTHPFLFLFNYSVAPVFRSSPYSRAIMERFVHDLDTIQYQGLACITVSEDGARVARRFGMTCSGHVGELHERVFVKRNLCE